jgi:predicted DCC family thiol-disulfide oxidoreductase YuxK
LSRRVRRQDRKNLVELVPFQADDLEARFPGVRREDCARALHLVDARGRIFRGARAVAEVWRRLGFGWRILGTISAYPPVLWGAMIVYRWVANHRHQLGPKTCEIPQPK